MGLAVYGKHPAKGDFLEHGLTGPLRAQLEGWLDAVLAEARTDLGAAWEQVWRSAPVLRFWSGEAIWGMPIAGVMAASQDRVGRRFPLVILCAGPDAARLPPPTVGGDDGWYDRMETHLRDRLAQADLTSPADLVAGATLPLPDAGHPDAGPPDFWAVRPGDGLESLFADIAITDHRRAAAGRSYWWVAGDPINGLDQGVAPLVADPDPDPVPGPGQAEDAAVDLADPPVAPAVPESAGAAPEAAAWDVAIMDPPEDEGSPFAQGSGLNLFAAPEVADAAAPVVARAPDIAIAPTAPRVLWSQVWAGPGLPNGAILAWFLRGVTDNG